MSSITRARLAVVLLIVAPFVLGTPALAGSRNWQGDLVCVVDSTDQDYGASGFTKLFNVHGDWTHGYFGDVTVGCQGLTPGATYVVEVFTGADQAWVQFAATKRGTGQLTVSRLYLGMGVMPPVVVVERAGDVPVRVLE
jgi:hypothetical protein